MTNYWNLASRVSRLALAAAAMALPASAYAQVQGGSGQTDGAAGEPDAATPAGNAEVDAGGLDEIVVTARRREESLQDVPIAVQAFSGAALEERNLQDATDLQRPVPSFTTYAALNPDFVFVADLFGGRIPLAASFDDAKES